MRFRMRIRIFIWCGSGCGSGCGSRLTKWCGSTTLELANLNNAPDTWCCSYAIPLPLQKFWGRDAAGVGVLLHGSMQIRIRIHSTGTCKQVYPNAPDTWCCSYAIPLPVQKFWGWEDAAGVGVLLQGWLKWGPALLAGAHYPCTQTRD